jgi:hypothetical protein
MAGVLLAVPALRGTSASALALATVVGTATYAAVLAVLAPADVREARSLAAGIRLPRLGRATPASTP